MEEAENHHTLPTATLCAYIAFHFALDGKRRNNRNTYALAGILMKVHAVSVWVEVSDLVPSLVPKHLVYLIIIRFYIFITNGPSSLGRRSTKIQWLNRSEIFPMIVLPPNIRARHHSHLVSPTWV
jgi:hypothetical protein